MKLWIDSVAPTIARKHSHHFSIFLDKANRLTHHAAAGWAFIAELSVADGYQIYRCFRARAGGIEHHQALIELHHFRVTAEGAIKARETAPGWIPRNRRLGCGRRGFSNGLSHGLHQPLRDLAWLR